MAYSCNPKSNPLQLWLLINYNWLSPWSMYTFYKKGFAIVLTTGISKSCGGLYEDNIFGPPHLRNKTKQLEYRYSRFIRGLYGIWQTCINHIQICKCFQFMFHLFVPGDITPSKQLVGGFNPSEHISQLGLLFPTYGHGKNVPTRQPDRLFWTMAFEYKIIEWSQMLHGIFTYMWAFMG